MIYVLVFCRRDMKQSYSVIAALYDKLSGNDCDYDRWATYICSVAKKNNVKKVVDLACGTAKMTSRLVKNGFEAVGVDNSEQMLAEARNKCRALFVLQDMTKLTLTRPADMAICVNDGVNYVSGDKLTDFFRRVADNLKAGAPFIFDYSTPYKLRRVLADNVFYVDEQQYTLLWTNKLVGKSLRINLTLFSQNGDGSYDREDETHTQYLHESGDVSAALFDAGFDVVEITADYGLNITDETQRLTFCCVKAR